MYAAILFTLLAPLSAQPDQFGLPACSGAGQELMARSFFLVCHSSELKVPLWTAYQLEPRNGDSAVYRPRHFRRDWSVSEGASDADYRNSGFVRGHMVPAADAAGSAPGMEATFLLSNAVPQDPRVNLGLWRKLENSVRQLAAAADIVVVITGPIFEGEIEFIGAGHVAIPSHTFKAVLAVKGNRKSMYAAIVPNQVVDEDLGSVSVPVEELERRSGLSFFGALAKGEQEQLKSERQLFPGRTAR